VYWACARLQSQRERLALHTLTLAGYAVYFPRLRHRRRSRGRHIETRPPLFPGYAFLQINGQWSTARYAPGVADLLMDGLMPAHVLDHIIDAIKARERNGLVELPRRSLLPGDRVQILQGPFARQIGLFAGMRAHERVAVLLEILGSRQRVTLAREDVEALDYEP
jgi:transcription antitermination factor NusG